MAAGRIITGCCSTAQRGVLCGCGGGSLTGAALPARSTGCQPSSGLPQLQPSCPTHFASGLTPPFRGSPLSSGLVKYGLTAALQRANQHWCCSSGPPPVTSTSASLRPAPPPGSSSGSGDLSKACSIGYGLQTCACAGFEACQKGGHWTVAEVGPVEAAGPTAEIGPVHMATKALLHPVGSLEARLSGLEGGLHRMCQLTSGAWLPLSQSLASYGLYASRTIHDQFTTLNGQAPATGQ